MTKARQVATEDIKQDLRINGKCFLAFQENLNPVMNHLVRQQLKEQSILSPFPAPSRANSQLVAHCFFCQGTVELELYSKYYDKQ